MMDRSREELEYEEKMDRVCECLEELILDAMLTALDKIKKRNLLFADSAKTNKVQNIQF